MIVIPLHTAASATKGGNKSGQSVASNSNAFNGISIPALSFAGPI